MQDKICAAVLNLSYILQAINSVLSVYCPGILSIVFGNGRGVIWMLLSA